VTHHLYLVFSQRPDDISDDEYHHWYSAHAQENIESPDFVSAQRYRVREVVAGEHVGTEQHLAVYEYGPPMSTWRTDLTRRIETGDVVLPEFFRRIEFRSWDCEPVGERLTPQSRGRP
jgi:hypothetical protein